MSKSELLKKAGFEEEIAEENKSQWLKTGFPQPLKRYRIIWEAINLGMEEPYFWTVDYLEKDADYPRDTTYKTVDAFAAAENSAFFGVTQQRIGLQQDKVSQFLQTIGKMIKEIFQLVRELRIIDERLVYYKESFEGKESAEITLKGIWIDMVEGGTKNPSSVFGMAREVQFTSLPDLFFSTNPKKSENVDDFVEKERGGFNKSVRNVLKRKLKMFLIWKEKTYEELNTRRNFTLKFLRQHYTVIKMYMTWVRPYLKHVRRLTLDEDKILTPDMVSAFEGSMVEVEFLATKDPGGAGKSDTQACILAHFLYRTRPSMSFQQEGYQRGPIHVGKFEMTLRAYAWTKKQIESYKKLRDSEDLELMKSISDTLAEAIDAMGDELKKYIEEAEGQKKEEEKKEKKPSTLERFKAEFFGPPKPKKPAKKPASDKGKAEGMVIDDMFNAFKNFKKAHGMVMW